MCGILGIFGYKGAANELEMRAIAKEVSGRQRHRGPDWSGVITFGKENAVAHERLSIVGVSTGSQPIRSKSSTACLAANGEIYNHLAVRQKLLSDCEFSTESDCEVILHLYEKLGANLCEYLDGIYAFILYDGNDYFVARDPIGVCSLYQGWSKDGSVWFASEMKCLVDHCERIITFPPGNFYSSKDGKHVPFYEPVWFDTKYLPTTPVDYTLLRESFKKAVCDQMMSEVPFGALLSGGLDSSLVSAILDENLKLKNPAAKLLTFSIGLPGAPDLMAARTVAEYLKTQHYEFTYTVEEGIDMIPEIISHLETYDVTTIRASTPMFFLARHIKALGVKMVLSGEGSDEIFAGYLYFHSAPDAPSLHQECVGRVKNLHLSDCLRANKSTMAWGVEARVPFLAKDFLDVVMTIDPKDKLCSPERMEKYILRKAFDVNNEFNAQPYLPAEVLWRQKEQFSDGVGYSWIDGLKAFTEAAVSDQRFAYAKELFPIDPPTTKEAFYYREIFEKLFPGSAGTSTVKRWIPRTDWGCLADPSGRAQKVHKQSLSS